jgi:hypothetical protein
MGVALKGVISPHYSGILEKQVCTTSKSSRGNDLNEYRITELGRLFVGGLNGDSGAPIDVFGVGTELATFF